MPCLATIYTVRVQLPSELRERIAELSRTVDSQALRRAAAELSAAYRSPSGPGPLGNDAQRCAYLLTRLPATFAAIEAVLTETRLRLPGWSPASVLDLGSGPGTAIWAAVQVFGDIAKATAIEQDAAFLRIAGKLLAAPGGPTSGTLELVQGDVRRTKFEEHDLVLASYSLGELTAAAQEQVIASAWEAARSALVLIEPGTPRGFEVMANAREQLLSAGARLAAPCPHEAACPMRTAGDWCHFSARVERTSEHRRLKQAELGYEDEKFSYLVATRLVPEVPAARIVRHPMRHSGFAKLQLCARGKLETETVTRSQKEKYRAAKRAEWGSGWES